MEINSRNQFIFCIMKFFLFFIILFYSYSIYSQDTKKVAITNQYWIGYSGQFRVSNKLNLIAESTLRSMDHSVNKLSQSLVSAALSWGVNDFVKLSVGYAYGSIFPATSKISVTKTENRLWQQIQLSNHFASKKITQGLRLEERFRRGLLTDSTLAPSNSFNFRFRYNISGDFPLSKNGWAKNRLSLILSEEIFINVGKQIVFNYFDQNRVSVGLKLKITEGNNIQLGYLDLFQQLPTGNQFRNLHVLRLNYFQDLDLRKRVKS